MTNDAAERLLAVLDEATIKWPDDFTYLAPSLIRNEMAKALAAERRAGLAEGKALTVERIRAAIEAHVREFANVMPDGQEQGYADCLAILDAEADR